MSLLALFGVLRARAAIIIWAVLVACAVAWLVSRLVPQTYTSHAIVQADSIQENLLTGMVEPRLRVSEFLGQQAAVISSRTVALQVVDVLEQEGYVSRAQYETEWRDVTGGELVPGNDAKLWFADRLSKSLSVRANVDHSTLTIGYTSENASMSARYANAYADAYMLTVLQQRQRRAARNAANFSEETLTLEQQVQDARDELTQFQQDSGIVTIGTEQLESAEVELSSLTARLAEARGDYAEARSLFAQVRRMELDQLGTIPLPDYNLPGRTAQARVAALNTQLERLYQRYGERNPDYIEARAELRNQQNIIFNSVRDREEFTRRKVESLAAEVERQKQQVVSLQKTKQRFDTLENNLETNRQAYDLLATRTLQEGLQSRFDAIDVLLLSRAVPAGKPFIPIKILIILGGAVVGLGMGLTTAVLIELLEGRLRSRQGLAFASKSVMLAEIRVPRTVKARYYA